MSDLFSLANIIVEIDDAYPAASTFTQDQKIRWINKEIREVWKEMALDEVLTIPTRKGDSVYELPKDIEFEMMNWVTVDEQPYVFRDMNQGRMPRTYYRVYDGQQNEVSYMGIYPVPSIDNLDITIGYWKRPDDLSVADLANIPNLRQDYLEVIVCGVVSRMCKYRQDVDLANNWSGEKATWLAKIKQERFENMPNYPVVRATNPKSVRPSGRGGRIAGRSGEIAWYQ